MKGALCSILLTALLTCVVANPTSAASSKQTPAKPELSFEDRTAEAKRSLPEDCTAQQPAAEDHLLDWTSDRYSKIKAVLEPGQLREHAAWRKKSLAVIATRGGCAHYGVSFAYVLEDATGASDRTHYLGVLLRLLKDTPMGSGAKWRDDIVRVLAKAAADGRANEPSFSDQPGYSTVHYKIRRLPTGTVQVTAVYDIAL